MDLREEFARFAELMPEATLLVAADGQVLAVNRRIETLFDGAHAPELPGRRLAELAADDPDQLAAWMRACARSTQLLPGALRLRRGDGGVVECRAAGGVYRPASETAPAVILVRLTSRKAAVDPFLALNLRIEELTAQVARRHRAEQALQAEREWLRVTLESIGDAVIATDEHGRVVFLNPVAQRLTGWTEQEARERPLSDIFVIVNEYTLQPVPSPVERVLREGVVVGLANHTILLRRDGLQIPIDDSGAPIRGERGELIGVVLVFHDITERRKLERELESRNRNLLDADRRKDEFLAMLAHELRNPLAPLRTGIDIMSMTGTDPQSLDELAVMMARQVGHLTHLVDDLLDVSRITRGRIELSMIPVTLQPVLRHALEMVDEQMTRRGHHVVVNVPDEPLTVRGDETRLAQVFSNLLSNAAKFTEPGGRITVSAETESDSVRVQVLDNGAGIEPELLTEIFELFTQADRSLDRSQGGLGLGLTVARRVVELHGGSIEARSAGLGHGSEFVVVLPLMADASAAAGPAPSVPASRQRTVSRRILLVDDNRDAAEALAVLVRMWGHETRLAHDGEEGLEAAREFLPHVVLLDLGLPGIDGFEVARRLRRQPELAGARLIAVTGYGREEDRQVSAEAGFDAHLTKPVDSDVVARLLDSSAST